MKVRVTRDALADLDAIFAYIAKENPTAAAKVVDTIERLIKQLSDFPERGQKSSLDGIRRLPVVRYPYAIFYEVGRGEVVIHHVRHGARRPWTGERR
jgi:addiction module RelE/StbE family toxin